MIVLTVLVYSAFYLQLEQEMAMVSEKPNVKASFLQQWKNFVPALMVNSTAALTSIADNNYYVLIVL